MLPVAEARHWDRAEPARRPSSDTTPYEDRSPACRNCKRARRDGHGRTASFQWDRIASRRCSPTERKVYRRGYSGLCRRRVGLREWDSSDRRKSSELDCSRVFRRAKRRPRGLVRRGWYAGWARLCFYFSADGSVMALDLGLQTSDLGPEISSGTQWPAKGFLAMCCCNQRSACCSMTAACLRVMPAARTAARSLFSSSPRVRATAVQK